jgi:ATP-binding cassette subfamily F protein uup
VETLELLEALLVDFGGTTLLVSHDRAFLNNVVTSTLAIEPDGSVKEYDGGYDDYLLQRPAKPERETASRPVVATPPAPVAGALEKPRKLNNKERRELESLPGKIEELEAAIRVLHDAMADPAYYKRTGAEIAGDKLRLESLEQELAAAYERWDELA